MDQRMKITIKKNFTFRSVSVQYTQWCTHFNNCYFNFEKKKKHKKLVYSD